MKKKKRTYSLRLIRDNYTYTVEQIADLYGVDVHTVRRWIREDGLKRIPKMRPYLIHSSDLRKFLDKKQKARKQPCKNNEAYCLKCRLPRKPKVNSATITKMPNKSVRMQAKCHHCNTRINRTIKAPDWSLSHPLSAYLKDAPKQHNRDDDSHRECNLETGGQYCLNITP